MEGVGEDSRKEEAHINVIGLMLIDHIDHLYRTDISMAGDEDKMSEMVMSSCYLKRRR